MKKKEKVEYRYYEIPEKELVLALLGEEWIMEYGKDLDYLHFHNYMEIGICHFGEGEVVIGEDTYSFQKGSNVIIPPNIPHNTSSTEGTNAYWEWMYFDIESAVSRVYPRKSIEFKETLTKIYERPYHFAVEEHPVLADIMCHIRDEMAAKRNRYRYSVEAYLQAFVVEILRMRHEKEKKLKFNQKKTVISPAIEYVTEHYQEEIKISHLAEVCNISESHFRRVFHEIMNMKPNDYVNLVRIHNACEYIRKSNKSMEEIAFKTGFVNISTFNRNFKKLLGTSPYQWKNSKQNPEGKLRNYRISAQKGW